MLFDQTSHSRVRRAWAALRTAKITLSAISAQEKFAQWARQRRLVDQLQATYDKESKLCDPQARFHHIRLLPQSYIHIFLANLIQSFVFALFRFFRMYKNYPTILSQFSYLFKEFF